MELNGCNDIRNLQQQHRQWLSDELVINNSTRDIAWTESLAVGSEIFVDEVQALLGSKARNRKVTVSGEKHILRETAARYNANFDTENSGLNKHNRLLWDVY